MTDAERTALKRTLEGFAGAATLAATALPEPAATVVRLVSAAFGVGVVMLTQGATAEQAIAAIKRMRHIDTSADDAEVDRKVDAKPIGKRYQELRPVMHAVPVLDAPSGPWSEPGEGD